MRAGWMGRVGSVGLLGVAACSAPLPDRYPGTAVRFDPEAADAGGDAFFEAPFPADARRTPGGGGPWTRLPGLGDDGLFFDVAAVGETNPGYPVSPVVWFRFDGPVAVPDGVVPADADAPILLLDVDPDSPERGAQVPVVAVALPPDPYTPPGVVGVAPVPGIVLRPDTTYAVVVRRALGDADGAPLGVGPGMLAALRGDDDDAWGLAPLRATLDARGEDVEALAAATVFTTGDAVAALHALTEEVRGRYAPAIDDLALAPDRGLVLPGYCELHGTLEVPEFQDGLPPYDTGGVFQVDDDGALVAQRTVRIPVVVTVPHGTMPEAGWPLALYFHGSGGTSDQLVIRGPRPGPGADPEVGTGPAYVLASKGIAAAGSAHPVNPERVPGAASIAYLNFNNLAAFRDTFRQGVIEQRLYLDALLALEIAPDVLDGCPGPALPAGAAAHTFDPASVVAMGQSMGGMYTNMIGAVEPRIRAVVPTGAGGHWSRFILVTRLLGDGTGPQLLRLFLGTGVELSWMHPALHMAQAAWEPSEPMIYTPRLARRPLDGHPVRPVYQPVGLDDSYFPPEVFDAMALAYGTEQAGDVVWPSMQDALALDARDGLLPYPVTDNRASETGTPFTAVVVQYPGDGFSDPHTIFTQYDAVKHQYACFFRSFLDTGAARVVEGVDLATPCE